MSSKQDIIININTFLLNTRLDIYMKLPDRVEDNKSKIKAPHFVTTLTPTF